MRSDGAAVGDARGRVYLVQSRTAVIKTLCVMERFNQSDDQLHGKCLPDDIVHIVIHQIKHLRNYYVVAVVVIISRSEISWRIWAHLRDTETNMLANKSQRYELQYKDELYVFTNIWLHNVMYITAQ